MRLLTKHEVKTYKTAEETRLSARLEELARLVQEQERKLQELTMEYENEKIRIDRLVDKLTDEAIRRASLLTHST